MTKTKKGSYYHLFIAKLLWIPNNHIANLPFCFLRHHNIWVLMLQKIFNHPSFSPRFQSSYIPTNDLYNKTALYPNLQTNSWKTKKTMVGLYFHLKYTLSNTFALLLPERKIFWWNLTTLTFIEVKTDWTLAILLG